MGTNVAFDLAAQDEEGRATRARARQRGREALQGALDARRARARRRRWRRTSSASRSRRAGWRRRAGSCWRRRRTRRRAPACRRTSAAARPADEQRARGARTSCDRCRRRATAALKADTCAATSWMRASLAPRVNSTSSEAGKAVGGQAREVACVSCCSRRKCSRAAAALMCCDLRSRRAAPTAPGAGDRRPPSVASSRRYTLMRWVRPQRSAKRAQVHHAEQQPWTGTERPRSGSKRRRRTAWRPRGCPRLARRYNDVQFHAESSPASSSGTARASRAQTSHSRPSRASVSRPSSSTSRRCGRVDEQRVIVRREQHRGAAAVDLFEQA